MAKQSSTLLMTRKFRMLRVKQILERETDASHFITMTQLLEMLNEDTESDRRTLYDDIKDLKHLGTIVDIKKGYAPPRLSVKERLFTIDELKLIIDAVASSKFLTQKATQEIIDKLKGFCSRYEATELNRQTLLSNRAKRIDAEYHNNVGILSKAIEARQKVSFSYYRLNIHNKREYNKKESVVSPWIMLYYNDNYYLMAYDGKIMRYYRLDRIDTVNILDEKCEGEEEYKMIKEELPFRTQSSFNLFGGEKKLVTLRVPVHFYYIIADQFGTNLYPVMDKNKEFFMVTVPVAVGDQFFGWVLSMGNKVTIIDPPEVKKQMVDMMTGVLMRYER